MATDASPWLEIVLPVRNPGSKFLESVQSVLAQTERGFGVVLSDCRSDQGVELLEEGRRLLEAQGVPVSLHRPERVLGRVEHWNWAHHQARGQWLKPLFAGDLLLPGYVATLRQRVQARPEAQVARCNFAVQRGGQTEPMIEPPTSRASLTPREFLKLYPSHGNWLGGPVNFAYTRLAWLRAGGYPTHLPACADLNLYVQLALRHGLELMPESLTMFQLHEQRFTHGITKRRVNGLFELWLTLREARNYCLSVGLDFPQGALGAALLAQARHDYWYPLKKRVKRRVGME